MRSFLRLFKLFRLIETRVAEKAIEINHLQHAIEDAETRNIRLQDHLADLETQNRKLLEMVEQAQGHERRTYQTFLNFDMQQRFGVAPFPEAVQLPKTHVPEVDPDRRGVRNFVQGASIVAKGEADFRAQTRARLEQIIIPQPAEVEAETSA